MTAFSVPSACRAFEEALLSRMEEAGPDAPIPAPAGHGSACADCRTLVAILERARETLRSVASPRPSVRLLRALSAPPPDFGARREAAGYLELLSPGVLALPEPSAELMGRLRFLPTREGAAAEGRAAARPAWRRWLGDWRVTVALAYVATLVIVTILGVDPMSAARDAASSLTAAGERAVDEARKTAVARLDAAAEAEAAKPLADRLDYRIYRAFAAGKARAVALVEVAFDNVFGSGAPAAPAPEARESRPPADRPDPRRSRRPPPTPEPDGKILRS